MYIRTNRILKKNKQDNEVYGFNIGTKFGLALMAVIGIGLIIIGYFCFGTPEVKSNIKYEMLLFAGETLIGTAVLTAVVEMHSIKKNYEKVRDYLLLEEPSFIERYGEEEVDKILNLAIKQKVKLKSRKELEINSFNWLMSGKNFLLEPYIEYTAEQLGDKGFYCTSHRRQINITPISNVHYKIHVTVELELSSFITECIKDEQIYKFYYISQKQIDSFRLIYLEINGKGESIDNLKLKKYPNTRPSTERHPFNYFVEFAIPIFMNPGEKTHYILDYEYCNYEQSCYITYSLPYITKSFQETYSLVGDHSYEYQIHASAYAPYKNLINSRSLVQRLNETTLSINSDNWMVPGSGFVSVIRKKMKNSEPKQNSDVNGAKMK